MSGITLTTNEQTRATRTARSKIILYKRHGDQMKIAIISSQAGSLINFRGPLLVKMKQHGHEIIALAPNHDAKTCDWLKAHGIVPVNFQLARTGMNPFKDAISTVELARLLR